MPPWLLDDDDDEVEEDSAGVCFKHPIGPSEDDFLHWSKQSLVACG